MLGVATGIVVFVYLIIAVLKKNVLKTDRQQDMIPIAGPVIGALIAIIIYLCDMQDYLGVSVGDNVLQAILMGIGSGLVATGGNQLFKKVNKLAAGDYTGLDEDLDKVINEAEDLGNKENSKIDDGLDL